MSSGARAPLVDRAAVVGEERQDFAGELAGADEDRVRAVGEVPAHGAAVGARAQALEMFGADVARVGEQALAEAAQPPVVLAERGQERLELSHDLRLAQHRRLQAAEDLEHQPVRVAFDERRLDR